MHPHSLMATDFHCCHHIKNTVVTTRRAWFSFLACADAPANHENSAAAVEASRLMAALLASISAAVASVCTRIQPAVDQREGSRAAGVVICFTFNKMGLKECQKLLPFIIQRLQEKVKHKHL